MKETTEESADISEADFMKSFFKRHKTPQETIDHFASIPWASKHLRNPAYEVVPTFSRHLKKSGEDYYFSRTINTESTLPHMLSLQLKNFKTVEETSGQSRSENAASSGSKSVVPAPDQPEAIFLIQVGKSGLDGHPSTIHGGVTCAILDETMGILVMLHQNNLNGPGPRDTLFTANLNVSYRAPVPTPSVLLVKTWLTERTGRKWKSRAHITDEHGKVLADAEGLWLSAKSTRL